MLEPVPEAHDAGNLVQQNSLNIFEEHLCEITLRLGLCFRTCCLGFVLFLSQADILWREAEQFEQFWKERYFRNKCGKSFWNWASGLRIDVI